MGGVDGSERGKETLIGSKPLDQLARIDYEGVPGSPMCGAKATGQEQIKNRT